MYCSFKSKIESITCMKTATQHTILILLEAKGHYFLYMDGWMTCDFTSFSTVFQSYQDGGRLIMKGCVQWNSFMVEKISLQAGIELGPLVQ